MRIESRRLAIASITNGDQPQEFLSIFNSNPEFIEASEQFTDKRAYELDDVSMYLYEETNRENSRCLTIRLRDAGTPPDHLLLLLGGAVDGT